MTAVVPDSALRGSCLCGAVVVLARPMRPELHACHCEMCRRWTGSAFVVVPVDAEGARFEGAESIRTYPSSAWAERGFCGRCGTHLFYYYKPEGTYACPVGFFADPGDMALTSEIFVDEQPAYYSFAESTVRKTAAQVMAQIAQDKG